MSKRISPQTGLLLAGVGAAGVLGSLWLPWYTIRLPQAFRDLFSKMGGGATPSSSTSPSDQIAAGFGAMMKGLAAAIPDEITGSGWQTMGSADWVLAVVAGLALLAAVAIGGGLSGVRADAGQVGRFIAAAGVACTVIAVYHVLRHPGAGASMPGFDHAVTVRYGAYVAALGGLLMIAGGLFAGGAKTALAPAMAPETAGPVYTPPEPYAPPATPDPFATPDPAPAPMPAADPFGAGAAPAPVMSTPMAPPAAPAAMPAADPFAAPAMPTAPAMTPAPSAPREPGSSVAPPGWAPPGT